MSWKSVKPTTPKDKALSKRHLKESVKFNKAHAKDHEKAAKEAARELKKRK